MIVKKKFIITAAVVLIATVGVAGPLYALSCAYVAEVDVWELELVEVTADGENVEDLDEYADFDFRLESHPSGVRFVGDDVDGDDEYRLDFRPDVLPEKFEDDDQNQGGE